MKQSVHLSQLSSVLFTLAGLIDQDEEIAPTDILSWIDQGILIESLNDIALKYEIVEQITDWGDFHGYYYNALKCVANDAPILISQSGIAMLIGMTAEIIQQGKGWKPNANWATY